MKCPKCGAQSGDNWTQCKGVCPMPQSPHYKPEGETMSEPALWTKECAHCKHDLGQHSAKGEHCPMGRKDRTGGHSFHREQKFKAKIPGKAEKAKERADAAHDQ